MRTLSKIAGGLDAYEFYIEFALDWICKECGTCLDAVADATKEEAEEVPYGPWSRRQARKARELGWYVPPLAKNGSLVPVCLCPACSRKLGFVVADEKSA
jgi:hypothetical protein